MAEKMIEILIGNATISVPSDVFSTAINNIIDEIIKNGDLFENINIEKPVNTKEICSFLDVTEPTLIRLVKKVKFLFYKSEAGYYIKSQLY